MQLFDHHPASNDKTTAQNHKMKHVIISLICIFATATASSAQKPDTTGTISPDTVASESSAPGEVISETLATEAAGASDIQIVDSEGTLYLKSDNDSGKSEKHKTSDTMRILGLLMVFGSPIGIVWIVLGYRNARYREKLRVVEKSLDLRSPLPPEFFTGGIKPSWYNLYAGIIWIGIGVSTLLFFLVLEVPVWPIGFVPMFIGISKIIVYRVVKHQKDSIVPPLPDFQDKDA